MTREWKVGDRALLPVVVRAVLDDEHAAVAWVCVGGACLPADIEVAPADLIPDDRRPDWLPGQPGDVAEFLGMRWMRGPREWWSPDNYAPVPDADIPADAVLVLPAKTREA